MAYTLQWSKGGNRGEVAKKIPDEFLSANKKYGKYSRKYLIGKNFSSFSMIFIYIKIRMRISWYHVMFVIKLVDKLSSLKIYKLMKKLLIKVEFALIYFCLPFCIYNESTHLFNVHSHIGDKFSTLKIYK